MLRPDEQVTHSDVTLDLDVAGGGVGVAEIRTGRSPSKDHPGAYVEVAGDDVVIAEMHSVDVVRLIDGGVAIKGKEAVVGGDPVEVLWYGVPYRFPA